MKMYFSIKSTSEGAVLKRSKNFRPSAIRPSNQVISVRPSDHQKLPLTLPLSDRPTKKKSPDFFFILVASEGVYYSLQIFHALQ